MARFLGLAWLLLAFPLVARAQFQTCTYCDVDPLNPDPYMVERCQTGSVSLTGIGFQDTQLNDCAMTPTVGVRSTRPDRLQILSFSVLGDGAIEVSYQVPCDATEGTIGIDVTIDDDPADAIDAYACGNARIRVEYVCGNGMLEPGEECDDGNDIDGDGCDSQCLEEPTLDVRYGELSAMLGTQGVTVEWTTLAELGSVGFRVEVRRGLEASQFLPQLVPARGQPGAYQLLDASEPARRGESDAYRVHEIDLDGRGSVSDWVRVSTPLERRSGELRGAE